MDIEIQSCGNAGMAENGADGFIVVWRFNAPGGESVPQTMEFYFFDFKFF